MFSGRDFRASLKSHVFFFFFCQCVIMEAGDEVGEVFLS